MFPPPNTGPPVNSKDPVFQFKSKSRVLNAIYSFYVYLHNQVAAINNSKYFIGIIIIIMNIAGKFVNFKMSKTVESYLKFSFSRNILIFAMIWMGTRDIFIALLMTIIFIFIVDYLFNEESMFCCLPENFTDSQISKLEETNIEITPDDINTIKRIMEKMSNKSNQTNITNQPNLMDGNNDLVMKETNHMENVKPNDDAEPFSMIQTGSMARY